MGGLMVLACDANGWQPEQLDPILQAAKSHCSGGFSRKSPTKTRTTNAAPCCSRSAAAPELACVRGLSEADADFDERVEVATEHWQEPEGATTMVVFVDGLSSRISALVDGLFANFGLENNFIGGGAGSLSFQQQPCILTNAGLLADVAVLARLPLRSRIGVTHGWEPISEPMKVTGARGNVIMTLDWEPAFAVYKRMVEAHSGEEMHAEAFFALAKSYPFGMTKLGTEIVVRDPLMVVDGSHLVCVGEVPEGAFLRLLNGTPDTLIAAAREGARSWRYPLRDAEHLRQPLATCSSIASRACCFLGIESPMNCTRSGGNNP